MVTGQQMKEKGARTGTMSQIVMTVGPAFCRKGGGVTWSSWSHQGELWRGDFHRSWFSDTRGCCPGRAWSERDGEEDVVRPRSPVLG